MLLNDGKTKRLDGINSSYILLLFYFVGMGRLSVLHGQNPYATVCRTGEKVNAL